MVRYLNSLRSCDRAQSLVETAIALPFVIVVFLGMVELSHAYDMVHGMGSIGREAANIASRGATLAEAQSVALTNGSDLGIDSRGGVVVSRIVFTSSWWSGTSARIMEQLTSSGYGSLLGAENETASALSSAGYSTDTEVFAVELFLQYEPITPIGRWLDGLIPNVLYERAVF